METLAQEAIENDNRNLMLTAHDLLSACGGKWKANRGACAEALITDGEERFDLHQKWNREFLDRNEDGGVFGAFLYDLVVEESLGDELQFRPDYANNHRGEFVVGYGPADQKKDVGVWVNQFMVCHDYFGESEFGAFKHQGAWYVWRVSCSGRNEWIARVTGQIIDTDGDQFLMLELIPWDTAPSLPAFNQDEFEDGIHPPVFDGEAWIEATRLPGVPEWKVQVEEDMLKLIEALKSERVNIVDEPYSPETAAQLRFADLDNDDLYNDDLYNDD